MPRVKPGERQRAYSPKTRSGCKTFRRVKCDEAKPTCHNCCSTGRRCLGYNDNGNPNNSNQLLQVSQQISSSLAGTQRERRAFEFYCVRTSPRLAGSGDHGFWGELVIQRAYVDTGTRHAIIALAAFYEDFESRAENRVFALEQYNLAIRKHFDFFNNENAPARVEVYVSCLVFVCIEMLRANFTSAISLAQKSIRLLHDSIDRIDGQSSEISRPLLRFLQRQFRRIQVQAIGLIGRAEGGSRYPSRAAQILNPTIPSIFSSVLEAKEYLEFYSQLYSLTANEEQTCPGPADFDIRRGFSEPYIDILRQWTNAFDAFLIRRADSLTDQEMHTVRILRMHQLLSHVSLQVSTRCLQADEQEMAWDDYYGEFNDAVVLAESILTTLDDREDNTSSLVLRKPSFSLDLVSVGPLYDIARRCRDPAIRRKAIHILRTFRRREGMWDSGLAFLVAERIVAIEEDGVTVQSIEDVPSWRRIFNVHPVFDMEHRQIYLHYERKASATQRATVRVQEVIPYADI